MERTKNAIHDLAKKYFKDVVATRRHLHMHPELSFEEKETSAYVAGLLDKWGIPYKAGVGGYGIVAEIQGAQSTGKVTALRADMDALPITEANTVNYKSKNLSLIHI